MATFKCGGSTLFTKEYDGMELYDAFIGLQEKLEIPDDTLCAINRIVKLAVNEGYIIQPNDKVEFYDLSEVAFAEEERRDR